MFQGSHGDGGVLGATVAVVGSGVGAGVGHASVVGASVNVVGATVVGATVVGATVVGATVVGATVAGAVASTMQQTASHSSLLPHDVPPGMVLPAGHRACPWDNRSLKR